MKFPADGTKAYSTLSSLHMQLKCAAKTKHGRSATVYLLWVFNVDGGEKKNSSFLNIDDSNVKEKKG